MRKKIFPPPRGLGLGRSETLVAKIGAILKKARSQDKDMAVVIDGDGLWYLQQHHSILEVSIGSIQASEVFSR